MDDICGRSRGGHKIIGFPDIRDPLQLVKICSSSCGPWNRLFLPGCKLLSRKELPHPLLHGLQGIMPSWLETSWFEYPLMRPVHISHLNIVVLVVGLVYVVGITVLNVVAVGYESVPTSITSYNAKMSHFLPKSMMLPKQQTCDPSIVKINEGSIIPSSMYNGSSLH